MLAHVCWYLPSGEYDCEQNLDLQPLPKGTGPTYRVSVPIGTGISIGWRAVVNQSGAFRVSSVEVVSGGVLECLLTKAK